MAVYPYKNTLWVTSNRGLACFERAYESFKVYLNTEGISHNEFNFNSHHQDQHTGQLFFGGLDGITSFDPEDFIDKDEQKYPLIITELSVLNAVNGQKIRSYDPMDLNKEIEVNGEKENLEIEFALLNFEKSNKTNYAYTIEGFHDKWFYQKENKIRIYQLPYGNYNIKIKARDYQGEWAKNELLLNIQMEVPFYKKLAYQLLGILIFVLSGLSYLKYREGNSIKQQLALENIIQERTNELSTSNKTKDRLFAILAHDLRNPVIAFASLTESLNYLLDSGQTKRIKELGDFIEKEAKQLHHLLDNLLNWALSEREDINFNRTNVALIQIVNSALNNYINLKDRIGIEIRNEVPNDLNVSTDPRILETIFRNILSNAFRYTAKGDSIIINADQEDGMVKIQIADTGTGMTPGELENLFTIKSKSDEKGNTSTVSLGMHLCKELIEICGGQIKAASNLNQGTIITVFVPIIKE